MKSMSEADIDEKSLVAIRLTILRNNLALYLRFTWEHCCAFSDWQETFSAGIHAEIFSKSGIIQKVRMKVSHVVESRFIAAPARRNNQPLQT